MRKIPMLYWPNMINHVKLLCVYCIIEYLYKYIHIYILNWQTILRKITVNRYVEPDMIFKWSFLADVLRCTSCKITFDQTSRSLQLYKA